MDSIYQAEIEVLQHELLYILPVHSAGEPGPIAALVAQFVSVRGLETTFLQGTTINFACTTQEDNADFTKNKRLKIRNTVY